MLYKPKYVEEIKRKKENENILKRQVLSFSFGLFALSYLSLRERKQRLGGLGRTENDIYFLITFSDTGVLVISCNFKFYCK